MKLRMTKGAIAKVQEAGRIDHETKTEGWRKVVRAEFRTACRSIEASPTMAAPPVEESGPPSHRT